MTPAKGCGTRFQSTPPARGATVRHAEPDTAHIAFISIHAPREGGDYVGERDKRFLYKISIHAPREGGDSPLQ